MCKLNAANLDVRGSKNPNYKGGDIKKSCTVCGSEYFVPPHRANSKYCSMKCVGISQRGIKRANPKRVTFNCEVCNKEVSVQRSLLPRLFCCSKECGFKRRAKIFAAEKNPNWNGGISRLPYPFDWGKISKEIRNRDGNKCMNHNCSNTSKKGKIEAHHIDHDKMNVSPTNLIALCSVCNSRANFNRDAQSKYYTKILKSMHPNIFS